MKRGESIQNPDKVIVQVGADVDIRPHSKVRLTFNRVDKQGSAYVMPIKTYPLHPTGPFLGEVFEITTDARFSGVVKVAISFPGAGLTGDQKKNLRVYRIDLNPESVWEDVTLSIDIVDDIAYGIASHFSVFGVR